MAFIFREGGSSKVDVERKLFSFQYKTVFCCHPSVANITADWMIPTVSMQHTHTLTIVSLLTLCPTSVLSLVLFLLLWFCVKLCVYVISPLHYLDKADNPDSPLSGIT